jgi:hypothetical protein
MNGQCGEKVNQTNKYAFYLLKEIADWLSAGMKDVKSDWSFVWDENQKDFKAINKTDGSRLEIHLRNISGFITKKPEFNMCIFPRQNRRGLGRLNVDRLKFWPQHLAPRWEPHKLSDGRSDRIVRDGEVGTSNNKLLKSSSLPRAVRDRFSDTNAPISNG